MLAIAAYEWFLAAHLLAAVVWVGGGATVQVLAVLATRSKQAEHMARFAREAELVGMRVFLPASLLVLGFGFALVEEGHWGYDQFFVQLGLAGSGASAAVGIFFLGPEAGRIAKAIEAHGVESPEAQGRLRRIFLVSRVELLVLLAVVFVMAAKPFL